MTRSISKVPYLMQGLLDWMLESDLTPYLVLNARSEGVSVPGEFVQDDGSITLNISGSAVRHLHLSADGIFFDSRFNGRPFSIAAPIDAVLGLVSREAGDGLWFPENAPKAAIAASAVDVTEAETSRPAETVPRSSDAKSKASKPSHLSLVE